MPRSLVVLYALLFYGTQSLAIVSMIELACLVRVSSICRVLKCIDFTFYSTQCLKSLYYFTPSLGFLSMHAILS